MRAIHFMKIDYVLTRKQMYFIPVFFVLACAVGRGVTESALSLLVTCSYMFLWLPYFQRRLLDIVSGRTGDFC